MGTVELVGIGAGDPPCAVESGQFCRGYSTFFGSVVVTSPFKGSPALTCRTEPNIAPKAIMTALTRITGTCS